MFISPKLAIEQGWIQFPGWMSDEMKEKCIQPNAIDFTIDRLFTITPNDGALITEETRVWHNVTECMGDVWSLESNNVYDCVSDFYVEVPDNVACMLINRSSLNRLGIHLNSGLYDSSYKGSVGFTLHNRIGKVQLGRHTRVGQIIFVKSESVGEYAGGFNTEQGKHWTE